MGLERALRSALAEHCVPLEVVVSADSPHLDRVVDAVQDDRVRYFRNDPPLGMAGNFAASLDRARGRIIGLLNDDDTLLPGFVESAVKAFEGDPRLGVVFTNVLVDDGAQRRERRLPLTPGRYAHFLTHLLETLPILCSAALMRREAWEQVREDGLPDTVHADTLIWIRAAQRGWAFRYVGQPLVVYSDDPGGQQLSSQERRMRDDAIRLWSGLSFDDPAAEALRRRRLAEAHLLRAGTALRSGETAAVHANVSLAKRADPSHGRLKAAALSALALAPLGTRVAPVVTRVSRSVRRRPRFGPPSSGFRPYA